MSEPIQLFGAVAVRPAVLPLVSMFEAKTGLTVSSRWELNPVVKAQIEAGAGFDLVITNPNLIQQLSALGKVALGSQVAFGRISMGIAAKAGSRIPRIDTLELFVDALRSAPSIAYANEGTSGAFFSDLLERLDLGREIRPKLVPISGAQTATSVARGEAELAVVPVTSILAAAPDVILIGRFPTELGGHIDFDLGHSASPASLKAADRLAEFLTSPSLDEVLARAGVDRRNR